MKLTATFIFLFFTLQFLYPQHKPFVSLPEQLDDEKYAEWIAPHEGQSGVFLFRKKFHVSTVPDSFIIHVSADARYTLYVNGTEVSWGPAVGDMENWKYETVNIAEWLKNGENVLAARVWNYGRLNGVKQITNTTAFILQGDNEISRIANTDNSWKVFKDNAYYPNAMSNVTVGGGYIAGGTDSLIAKKHPWSWKSASFNDAAWVQAGEIGKGNHNGLDTWLGTPWKLQPRKIPAMEQFTEKSPGIVFISGAEYTADKGMEFPLVIPPNTTARILMDNGVLTMGFPQFKLSGGENAILRVRYQEALFKPDGEKGNRNEWQGKIMKGYYDTYLADGMERVFEPLWLRVFRYVEITVESKNEPLVILDFKNRFTAYPLAENAAFLSPDTSLQAIWDASWRTARLCALENYMDCPYYEQLQYIGDTRIQALISMYVDGDDRLARNAIQQIYASMQPVGLTKSAHPTAGVQIIPPFSLIFIAMIHDYYMLRDDQAFVRLYIPGIKFILEWFVAHMDDNGMLGPLPYWNHIDGGTDFKNGSPPGISTGNSAHMSILFAYALDKAAELLKANDFTCDADRFKKLSISLKENTYALCYNKERGLMAETPEQHIYSQHTNSFAVLAGMFEGDSQKEIMEKVVDDSSLIQTTLYFKFYLFQALQKAGMGEEILHQLGDWKKFLDHGLTTFPEHGLNSRSDCHAWSAHPLYNFLNITCGVATAAPGFGMVEVRPNPGYLKEVKGSVFHPSGMIKVEYSQMPDNTWQAAVELPAGISGNLVWGDTTYPLASGNNTFNLEDIP